MHIIIDGYNLIRQSAALRRFEKIRLEEARNALIRFLMPYHRLKRHEITIVFDGWKSGSFQEERDREGGIDIVYSRLGVKADDVIKRIVDKSGEEIMVVTSDRDIAVFVERRGGTAVSSREFEAIISRTPEELSTVLPLREGKIDDDIDEDPKGGRKKGPSRRISRREREYRKRIGKL